MTDEMNKHSKFIQNLGLSTDETLRIAIELIGLLNKRAELVLDKLIEVKDLEGVSPGDFVNVTNLLSVTDSALMILIKSLPRELLDDFDKNLFPLELWRESVKEITEEQTQPKGGKAMTELNNIIESLKLETHQVERLLKLVEGEINNTFQDWYMTNKGLMLSGVLAIRSELYDLASQLTKSLHDMEQES